MDGAARDSEGILEGGNAVGGGRFLQEEEETGASGERHDVREGFSVIGQFAINHGAAQIHNATRKTNRDGCERVGKRRKEGRLEENAPMRVDDLRLLSLRRIRKLVAILFVTLQSESHHFKHRT